MLRMFLILMLDLLGFGQQNNIADLHRKPEPIKLNTPLIIMVCCLIAFIIFIVFLLFIGHCTDSGVYYNSNIY